MYTKLWITFALCVLTPSAMSVEVPEELREMGEVLHAHCVGETKVNEQLIEDGKKGLFSEDTTFKCYLRCLYEETSMITDDGHFDTEALLGVLPPSWKSIIGPTVTSCVAKTPLGKDECESMWLVSKCFAETDPANYFLF